MDEPLTMLHNDLAKRPRLVLGYTSEKPAQRYTKTPNSFARATACVRRSTPSLLLIWLAWVFTVCREMNSWSLIS
jgi:hypothetical protein